MSVLDASQVRSGSHGKMWINNELAAEVYGFRAVINKTKESVPRCGAFIEGNKLMSAGITGTVKLYNATSRLLAAEAEALQTGRDVRYTLVSDLDDPDNPQAQRIQLTGVSFDSVTLADWEAAAIGRIEAPFTADGYTLLEY